MGLIYLIVDGIRSIRKSVIKSKAKRNLETKTITYQNLYAIDIPTILKSTKKLSDDASIQCYNKTLDMGVLVIDEPKDEFITEWKNLESEMGDEYSVNDTLADKALSVTLLNMFDGEDVTPMNYQSRRINGMPAVSAEVFKKATFTKDASYTHITCIEGRKTIYQVIVIVGGNSIPHFSSRLSDIASTLREL